MNAQPTQLLCLLIGLLTTTTATAQRNWQTGTITTTNGQQRSGEINDKFGVRDIAIVRFRPSKSAPAREYALKELSAFSIADRNYIVQPIVYNATPRRDVDLVSRASAKQNTVDAAALLELQRGNDLSLYQWSDDKGRDHFYLRTAAAPQAQYLPYARYKIVHPTKKQDRIVEDPAYRAVLLDAMQACDDASGRIVGTQYTTVGLNRLFEFYYACTDQQPEEDKEIITRPLKFTPTVGISQVHHRFGELARIDFEGDDEIRPFAPLIGVQLNYFLLGEAAGHTLRFSALYSQYGWDGQRVIGTTTTNTYTHRQRMVQCLAGVRVLAVRRPFPLFIDGSLGINASLSFTNVWNQVRTLNGEPIVDVNRFMYTGTQGASTGTAEVGLGTYFGPVEVAVRWLRAPIRGKAAATLNTYALTVGYQL